MSRLFIVPTPIGNLEDMTVRAIRILKEVDLILAEDTRQTRKLLQHYQIESQLLSHHQHNEHKATPGVIEKLKSGITIALVSDSGTPAISDPGFYLVRACIEADIPVECIPGATAFVPALVNSGIPCDRFLFEGFLPHKKGRATRLKLLAEENKTIILYESPHRILKTLMQLAENFGEDRYISISRELTKKFEETRRGSIREMIDHFSVIKPKGEFVLVIST